MEKFNTLGNLINFNESRNLITFQLDFVDEEVIEQIENLLIWEGPIKLSFIKVKPFRSRTYQQQKKFWVDFHKIMKAMEISETKDNCKEFYDFIKKNIFPAKKSTIIRNENNEIVENYYIPDMKDLSIEEMVDVISNLHDYYEYLNIDWDKIE